MGLKEGIFMSNPFNITFGELPKSVIEREKEANIIVSAFKDETPETKVFVITGPRGAGKTALLTKMKNVFHEEGYLTIDLNPFMEMQEQFASKLYEEGKLWKLFLHPEFSFSFNGLTFSLKGKTEINNISTLISRMLEYLKKKNKRVLITIDDVSKTLSMKGFVYAYQQWIREGYPVFLLMSGLYENVSEIERDKSLTFFLRAPKIMLEPLNVAAIAYSYKNLLDLDEIMAIKYAKLTSGYAYGYQLLGSLLYKNKAPLKNLDEYDLKLGQNAYSLIWEKLTGKEKEILVAMTKTSKVSEICNELSLSPGNLQTYKKRLMDKGLVVSSMRGTMIFALPRFKEFINFQLLLEE